jgi:hypothetical protein
MTTKPPSTVRKDPDRSLEAIAYASVGDIPTVEPHDRDRLGYNVWRWLSTRRDSLEFAVKTASARLLISEDEATGKIRESLRRQGVSL